MDADGNNVTQVTSNSNFYDISPTWSADGSQIAFESNREGSGGSDIYKINADGTSPVRITTSSAFEEHPSWSPLE